jgi:hypothetical protein
MLMPRLDYEKVGKRKDLQTYESFVTDIITDFSTRGKEEVKING